MWFQSASSVFNTECYCTWLFERNREMGLQHALHAVLDVHLTIVSVVCVISMYFPQTTNLKSTAEGQNPIVRIIIISCMVEAQPLSKRELYFDQGTVWCTSACDKLMGVRMGGSWDQMSHACMLTQTRAGKASPSHNQITSEQLHCSKIVNYCACPTTSEVGSLEKGEKGLCCPDIHPYGK